MREVSSGSSIARGRVYLWALLAGMLLACPGLRAQRTGPRPPIILISIDTLRADRLSCYGYRKARTPSIDALASNGTLFSDASSQIPITLASHLSLLTSTYPFANGVEENGEHVPESALTLAQVLRSNGYSTAAFIGGYFLSRQFGLDRGFDSYDSPFASDGEALPNAAALKCPASEVLTRAQTWLYAHGGASGGPFFLFVHLFDLHRPYTEPKRFHVLHPGSEYDAEVAYADSALGKFWRFLKNRGLFSRSLIVLLSDHGESLGEHGESTHGYFIYQSTLHVPLIIHWPEGAPPAPARVDTPVGLIDVAPTVLQFLGLPGPPSFQGRSLLGLLKGGGPQAAREVYAESLYAYDKFGWAPLRSLQIGDYQYIDAPKQELYDLARDPEETHNLISSERDLGQTLHDRLLSLRERFSRPGTGMAVRTTVSPEVLSNLRSLGYLGFSQPHASGATTGRDPKDRLAEYRQYLRGLELSQTGHLSEAAATFREVLDEDSQNVPAHDELADCYFQLRRFFDAVRELHASLALDPRDVPAEELLGSIWLETGDKPRARAEFERLLGFAPDDYTAHFGLGLIDEDAGHTDDAFGNFQAAIRVRPDSAEAHEHLGEIYINKGDFGAATYEIRRALELNPKLASARETLRRLGVRQ